MNLSSRDDCVRAPTGGSPNAFIGFRNVFGRLSTLELALFTGPAALLVESMRLVREYGTQEGDAAEGELGVSEASAQP